MCAVIDANVAAEAFGSKQTPTGKAFLNRVDSGELRLVTGGELHNELRKNGRFEKWLDNAVKQGSAIIKSSDEVEARASELRESRELTSNDAHVIAVAEIGGAQLLYSKDQRLIDDFKALIRDGKVLRPLDSRSLTKDHRVLLATATCRS